MKRALLPAVLLPLLAACDSQAASSPPSPRELKAREFIRSMKTIDGEYEALQKDLRDRKPADEAKARLAAIRSAAEDASRQDYRESEAENRDLAFEFRKFFDAAGKLENVTWSGEDGLRAWRRLGTACASCHDLYRKEPDR